MTAQEVTDLLKVINPLFPALGTDVTDASKARRLFSAIPRGNTMPPSVGNVTDIRIPGPSNTTLPLRIYHPAKGGSTRGLLPTMLYAHGGGWVVGDLESHDALVRRLVQLTGRAAISVDYRRAPEYPYPAALSDVRHALTWLCAEGPSEGLDPQHIALIGDSAGANLVAATCLADRDEGLHRAEALVLLYPMLDDTCASRSYKENATGNYITGDHLRWFWSQYLQGRRADDHAAPARATDLSGLPAAFIATAELDPLRDEGRHFAERLHSNVHVVAKEYRAFHGFAAFWPALDVARDALDDIAEFLSSLVGAQNVLPSSVTTNE